MFKYLAVCQIAQRKTKPNKMFGSNFLKWTFSNGKPLKFLIQGHALSKPNDHFKQETNIADHTLHKFISPF